MVNRTEKYNDSLKENIFSNVLELIASDDLLKSLLGHRILQHLMDRHENKSQFESARWNYLETHKRVVIYRIF